jgi:hypothetical protein
VDGCPDLVRADTIDRMNQRLAAQVLLVVSILYGITIAILAVTDASILSMFAFVGALAIGGAWAILGVFGGRRRSRD